MTVLTLFFAGSGHGFGSDDDTMVDTFKKTNSAKVFFPGPGGGDPKIYVGADYPNIDIATEASATMRETREVVIASTIERAKGRAVTGLGWNRNVCHAINIIADYLISEKGRLTINCVGHSRGSITVVMLLNDIFHQHRATDAERYKSFSIAKSKRTGVTTYKGEGTGFSDWYKQRLESIWASRMSEQEAYEGIESLDIILNAMYRVESVNAWMFDPVAGPFQGNTMRKQDFPTHPLIKRVRVLRMEHGGKFLNSNMGVFAGWSFQHGGWRRNLMVFSENERLVIPLPGSHGGGLSYNKNQRTLAQRYIGTSYMVGLLHECGTHIENAWRGEFGDETILRNHYATLFDEFKSKPTPKKSSRRNLLRKQLGRNIQTNLLGRSYSYHSKKGWYGGYINSHHRYLGHAP